MVEEVMRYCRNFFISGTRVSNIFHVKGGKIVESLPFIDNQFVWITGSTLNDGIYQMPITDLFDEEFNGEIIGLKPPKAFLSLVDEITKWQDKYSDTVTSPYQSESFNGYSYSKKSGTDAREKCTLINEIIQEDGYGNYNPIYKDGATFEADIAFNNSIEALRAANEGVRSLYKVFTSRKIVLKYHQIFRRESDRKIFRVTSDGDDQFTPNSATLDLRVVSAEEWELTNG